MLRKVFTIDRLVRIVHSHPWLVYWIVIPLFCAVAFAMMASVLKLAPRRQGVCGIIGFWYGRME